MPSSSGPALEERPGLTRHSTPAPKPTKWQEPRRWMQAAKMDFAAVTQGSTGTFHRRPCTDLLAGGAMLIARSDGGARPCPHTPARTRPRRRVSAYNRCPAPDAPCPRHELDPRHSNAPPAPADATRTHHRPCRTWQPWAGIARRAGPGSGVRFCCQRALARGTGSCRGKGRRPGNCLPGNC